MTPQQDDSNSGVEAIDQSIEHLQLKLNTLKTVQETLNTLENKLTEAGELTVVDANNDGYVQVTIRSKEMYDEIKELANTSESLVGESYCPANIIYDPNTETFSLERNFRVSK